MRTCPWLAATVPSGRRNAFTLPEVLLAVAIAAVLLGVLFSFYWGIARAVTHQEARRRGGEALAMALDGVVRDLQGALLAPGYVQGGLQLRPPAAATGASSVLELCTTRSGGGPGLGQDARWYEVIQVRYEVVPTADSPSGTLLRVEQALAGPDALNEPVTNRLFTGVAQFEVDFRHAVNDWTNEWAIAADDENPAWPQAARVRIQPERAVRGVGPTATETLVPVGWTFTNGVPHVRQPGNGS